MLKAVIFDVDGVLLDSFESNYQYFRRVFVTAGYKPLTKVEFRKAFHLTLKDLIDRYMSQGDRKEFRRVYGIAYRLYLVPELPKIQPDSVRIIRKLAKKYTLALVTGRIKEGVDEYLDYSRLDKCFKTVIHAGNYRNPKPHPEPILKALKQMKVKPTEAAYVGDTLTDILAARAAKTKIILFNKRKFGDPDYHISAFKELERVVNNIDK